MKIPKILVVPIYVAIVTAFSFLVGLIAYWLGAYNPNAWGFFTLIGIIGCLIFYIFGRQIWWFISGTGDYQDRNGLLKRLYKRIFKK
jgi:hypothetical protein